MLPTKTAGKNRWKYLSQSQQKADQLNEIINETLSPSGSLLVKLFNQQEKKNQQFIAINKEVTKLSIKESRAGKWFKVAWVYLPIWGLC